MIFTHQFATTVDQLYPLRSKSSGIHLQTKPPNLRHEQIDLALGPLRGRYLGRSSARRQAVFFEPL